jgi:hypothetical protein
MSGLGELIAEQSKKMEEQTDYFPDGASLVVTRSEEAEGNAVTVVFHKEEEDSPDDGMVLGFDDQTFDRVAADLARESTEPWRRLFPADREALEAALFEAEHALTPEQYDRLHDLMEAAPEEK